VAYAGCQRSPATKQVVNAVQQRAQGIPEVTGQGGGVTNMKAHAYYRVFLEILSYSGQINDAMNSMLLKLAGGPNARQHE
jgi:hypothetical protein